MVYNWKYTELRVFLFNKITDFLFVMVVIIFWLVDYICWKYIFMCFIVVLELISVYCMRDWFSFLSVSFMLILTAIILQFDSNFVIISMGNNWLVWLKVIEWYLWWFWLVGWSKKWRKQDVFVNEEDYDFDLIRELMEGRHWRWVVFFVEIICLIDNLS